MKGLFIIGTDTAVGKTFVAGAIAAYMRSKGRSVGVMKPAETGCRERDHELYPSDAMLLKKAAGTDDPTELICPYIFSEPLAPAVAAKRAGVKVKVELVEKIFRMLAERHGFVIVESAGGLMVPLSGKYLNLDLAQTLNLPVVIVGRTGLGTINHTMLSVAAARERNLKIAGIILNQSRPGRPGAAEETNPGVLRGLTGIRKVISLPYMKGGGRSRAALAEAGMELARQGFLA